VACRLCQPRPAQRDGTLDPAFQPDSSHVTALVVQPDAGCSLRIRANIRRARAARRVARLNADGSRDAGFNAYANGKIATLALQTDGRIVNRRRLYHRQRGGAQPARPPQYRRIARHTFDPNADNSVYSLAIQPDGKVLVGGAFSS